MMPRSAKPQASGLSGSPLNCAVSAAAIVSPHEAVERFRPYLADRLAEGVHFAAMSRHMLGLFQSRPGARAWRRILTVDGVKPGAGMEVLDRALAAVPADPAEASERRAAVG